MNDRDTIERMNLNIDSVTTEGLFRLLAFVLIGIAVRTASLRYPMPAYANQKIERFDLSFVWVALGVATAVEMWINPVLLQGLNGLSLSPHFLWDRLSTSPTLVQIIVYLVLTDFLGYAVHRFMHSPWAWRIHAFHHSVRSLNWISGIRGSPLHIVLILLPGTLISSLLLLPQNPTAFWVVVVFDVTSQHLNHSNVRLPFAKQLEWLLVTPQMHFLHHHIDERYGKCNYGFYFSIWDRVFGTYVDASTVANKGQLGLATDYTTLSMLCGVGLRKR